MKFEPLKKLPPLTPVKRSFVERLKEALPNVIRIDEFKGRRGRRGGRGLRGDKGDAGVQGVEGRHGVQGPQGVPGDTGDDGTQGERGKRGYKGIQGRAGEVGPVGPQGKKGDTGPAPAHRWQGMALSFKKPNGDWGKAVSLQGPAGGRGTSGKGASQSYAAMVLNGNTLELQKQGALGADLSVDLSALATGEELLAQRIDEESGGDLLYIGEAIPGTIDSAALWRIKRITFTLDGDGDTDSVTEWADGDSSQNNIWNNRLALSYS